MNVNRLEKTTLQNSRQACLERVPNPKQQAKEWSSKVQGSKHFSKSRSMVKFMRFQMESQGIWSLGK